MISHRELWHAMTMHVPCTNHLMNQELGLALHWKLHFPQVNLNRKFLNPVAPPLHVHFLRLCTLPLNFLHGKRQRHQRRTLVARGRQEVIVHKLYRLHPLHRLDMNKNLPNETRKAQSNSRLPKQHSTKPTPLNITQCTSHTKTPNLHKHELKHKLTSNAPELQITNTKLNSPLLLSKIQCHPPRAKEHLHPETDTKWTPRLTPRPERKTSTISTTWSQTQETGQQSSWLKRNTNNQPSSNVTSWKENSANA